METVQTALWVVMLLVVLALAFDFMNGFHDAANSIATVVSTGVLKPTQAVLFAAFFNFIAIFVFHLSVAATVGKGIVQPGVVDTHVVFGALVGAITWNIITWYYGIPSSSSHALFGGLVGAAIAFAGMDAVNAPKILEKVVIPALFAPAIAGLAAFLATRAAYLITARTQKERSKSGIGTGRNKFKIGQIFSSSLVALSHGTNDAQKTMGVITLVLVAAGFQSDGHHVEFWVVLTSALAIALGTYSGGWRIIKTMGTGLSEIKPAQGFAAEVATGVAILASSKLGFALSTTQVASGSVIGSGLGRKGGAVRWSKAGQIVVGWLFTLPAAGIVGALSAFLVKAGPVGFIADAVITLAAIIAIFQISKRNKVAHHNVVSEIEGASEVVASPRQVRKAAAKAAKAAAKAGKKKDKK